MVVIIWLGIIDLEKLMVHYEWKLNHGVIDPEDEEDIQNNDDVD